MKIPEIIAHRGASKDQLENSLAAFAEAIRQGADAIELDVHRTSDGVIVVHHDDTVRDVTSGTRVEIARSSASDLAKLRLSNGERIPTLDEVFELTGNRTKVYTEVKGRDCERALADCFSRHSSLMHAVHSFDHRIPVAVKRLYPTTETGFLSTSYPLDIKSFTGPHIPNYFWQHTSMIDESLVELSRQAGMQVVAWTENSSARAAALTLMSVSAICTDTPALLRASLESSGQLDGGSEGALLAESP